MNDEEIFISVIIPTYKDWDRLNLCIKSLEMQSLNPSSFEVIIVNNAQEDKDIDLKLSSNFFLITENKPGSYFARNAAIKIAKGNVFAFTDSDCIVDPDWLANAIKLIKKYDRIAGHVELFYSSNTNSFVELFEKAFSFDQKFNASRGTSVTANMITRSSCFEKVGLFNDSLLSGGDIEWGWRANNLGHKIYYATNVIVNHPARNSLNEIIKKKKRVSGGELHIENKSLIGNLLRLLLIGFLPPFSLKKLVNMKDLTKKEKIIAGLVAYYLKLYSTFYKFGLLFGFVKYQRS